MIEKKLFLSKKKYQERFPTEFFEKTHKRGLFLCLISRSGIRVFGFSQAQLPGTVYFHFLLNPIAL